MKKIVTAGLYQCSICKLHYQDQKDANSCYQWCKDHNSCNLKLTKKAVERKVYYLNEIK